MATVLDLGGQVAEALRNYVERNPESRRLHEERARFMPGGNPLTVVRGDGARIVDADGHEYLDFLGEYTAGLYGHSHPAIVQAIRDALADGIVLGAPNVYEGGLAAAVCERFPSIELVRFCNSGTEARRSTPPSGTSSGATTTRRRRRDRSPSTRTSSQRSSSSRCRDRAA